MTTRSPAGNVDEGARRATPGDRSAGAPAEAAGVTPAPLTRPDPGPPPPGAQPVEQPGSGLGLIVSIGVALVVFVLSILASGARPASTRLPLLQTTNALYWSIAVLAVVGAGIGAEYAERVASRHGQASGRSQVEQALPTAWIVPVVSTAAAVLLVATFHNAPMMVVGPLTAFLGSAGALLARDLLDDATDTGQRSATTIHTLVVHAAAFMALSAIYLNKLPTPISAIAVGIVGGLLTLEALERGTGELEQRVLYAVIAGLVMAQATVALMWWQTHGWTGGAVLLVCFYITAGVLLARTQRSVLRSRDLLEFGAVSLVALAILALTA